MANENVTSRKDIQNPWNRENRAEYKMGVVEQALHNMGFRTGYDTYHMEMDNNAKAFETQNQSLEYEEMYNSAEEQAQRLREAGINPDLNQSDINAGQASEMAEPETTIPGSGLTDIEQFEKVGGMVANLGAQLLDIYTGSVSASVAMGKYKIAKEEFESNRDLQEDEYIAQEAIDAIYKYGSDEEYENGAHIAHIKGLTGKRFEKFARTYDEMYRSLPGLIQRNNAQSDEKDSSFRLEMTDTMNDIKRTMADAEKTDAQILLESANRKAKFLQDHPQYTAQMMNAGLQKEISEAKALGHEAKIKEYQEAVAEWNKIEADTQHQITQSDLEYVRQFQTGTTKYDYNAWSGKIPVEERNHWTPYYFYKGIPKWLKYRSASKRLYGRANDNSDLIPEDAARMVAVKKLK